MRVRPENSWAGALFIYRMVHMPGSEMCLGRADIIKIDMQMFDIAIQRQLPLLAVQRRPVCVPRTGRRVALRKGIFY
jgi:hypothetical protein